METQTTLNQRIDQLLKGRNFTQMHVAKNLSISKQTVSNWVSGNVQVPVKHLVELIKLCKPVNLNWLLLGNGKMDEIEEKSHEEDTNLQKMTGQVELLKEIIEGKDQIIGELQEKVGSLKEQLSNRKK